MIRFIYAIYWTAKEGIHENRRNTWSNFYASHWKTWQRFPEILLRGVEDSPVSLIHVTAPPECWLLLKCLFLPLCTWISKHNTWLVSVILSEANLLFLPNQPSRGWGLNSNQHMWSHSLPQLCDTKYSSKFSLIPGMKYKTTYYF